MQYVIVWQKQFMAIKTALALVLKELISLFSTEVQTANAKINRALIKGANSIGSSGTKMYL